MYRISFTVICLVLAYVILLMLPGYNGVQSIPFYQNKNFNNIAHGTARELLPGNTLEGALNAVAVGADIIELDIHLTADNVVVVRHDASVDLTTNGSGLIADMTLIELQAFDVGFHEIDYPEKQAVDGIRVPTLESLFEALPDRRFLIELKPNSTDTGVALCQLVLAHGLQNQVVVGSFYSSVLRDFRRQCPDVPTSLGEEEVQVLVLLSWIGLGHLYSASGYSVQLPFEYKGVELISKSLLRTARELNLAVDVWTINDPQQMLELKKLGVNGIITDRPDVLHAIDI
ncbi:glycerophosphodiester phosphodiesterase [Porticoccaceae bacterium]|nr:glycerophosphodiester phosphodiesterase [Porticoccaceae bacterium]